MPRQVIMQQTTASAPAREEHAAEKPLFLTPEWVEEVRRAVEAVKTSDPYFRMMLNDFTMNVKYVIHDLPAKLRPLYGTGREAAVFVRLHQGTVQGVQFGRKPAGEDTHLVVTIDYETAKRLFRGESSPARAVISQDLKAEPVNGFRHWHRVAAKSIITASRVLRTARKVPTSFEEG